MMPILYPASRTLSIIWQRTRVFSIFDLNSAYHLIAIQEADKPYTAFEPAGKLLEFNCIPFGITNGAPQFHRKIDQTMEEDKKDMYSYLHNVTVGGRNQQEHNDNIKRFLQSISKR